MALRFGHGVLPFAAACLLLAPLRAQDTELEKAANRLAARIEAAHGGAVAVADFTDLQGRITELGRFFAEELSVALVNAPSRLKVIDRGHIRTLLKEHKFQASGLIDESTASELGRLAGVGVLVTGSVTEQADGIRVTLKALETKTAAIQAALAILVPKSATTADLLRRDIRDSGPAATVASAGSGPARPAGVPNVRLFQNDFLVVGVESAVVRQTGDNATLSVALTFENKSAQDEYLAYKSPSHLSVSVHDGTGRDWDTPRLTGLLGTTCVGVPCADTPKERYTRISAGSRQMVLLQFHTRVPKGEELTPATGSLALELFRFSEKSKLGYQGFSVGLTGLPIAK
jgi:TolB-like protein